MCDPDNISNVVAAEKQLVEGGNEFEEDLALITDSNYKNNISEKTDEDTDSQQSEELEEEEEQEEFSEDDVSEGEDEIPKKRLNKANKKRKCNEDDDDNDDGSDENFSESENEEGTWTDIYGRLRGKDGTVIEEASDKYIPPAKRAVSQFTDKAGAESLLRLQRQLKGSFYS